jgi:hypothetical protein
MAQNIRVALMIRLHYLHNIQQIILENKQLYTQQTKAVLTANKMVLLVKQINI